MKKKLFLSVFALALAVIIGMICAFSSFFSSSNDSTYVSTTLELLYDGAADGVDLNGQYYSENSIITEDMVWNALVKLGCADEYSSGEVMNCINITGSYPENIIEQITSFDSVTDTAGVRSIVVKDYYPTNYTITLSDDFSDDMGETQLKVLLRTIMDEYSDAFVSEYSKLFNFEGLNDALDISGLDYTYKVTLLNTKLNLIKKYASYLYDLKSDFSFAGTTFKDIVLRCETIEENYIDRMNVNIAMNSLSIDKEKLIDQYSYEIKKLEYTRDKKQADYVSVSEMLEAYERDSTVYVSSGDSILKVESKSGEVYDGLSAKKLSLAEAISQISSDISDYTKRIDDIKQNNSAAGSLETLKSDLDYVSSQIDLIKASLDEMVEKYNEKYVCNGSYEFTDVEYHTNKLFSAAFIVTAIKCVGPFVVIALVVILAGFMLGEIKKNKSSVKSENIKA